MRESKELSILAQDMVPVWRSQICKAETSIVLVSPYLDELVIELLSESQVQPSDVIVLTDLTPASNPIFYKKQLQTLVKLDAIGYRLFSIDRVHAKLLITDDESISLGSQNFTNYGRKSKEVSAFTSDDSKDDAINEVKDWIKAAKSVPLDLLNKLLSEADKEIQNAVVSHEKLDAKIKSLINEYVPRKVIEFENWRKNLTSKISKQIDELSENESDKTIGATITQITSNHNFDEYSTLLGNFYFLFRSRNNSSENFPTLMSLSMYPILFSDTGTMGFARVGESRITYIRSSVKLTRRKEIAGHQIQIIVSFPKTKDRNSNIQLVFRTSLGEKTDIYFNLIFDGENIVLVEDNLASLRISFEVNKNVFVLKHLSSLWDELDKLKFEEEWLKEILSEAFEPFTFETLERDYKNIETYAHGKNYRVALSGLGSSVILLAECIDL